MTIPTADCECGLKIWFRNGHWEDSEGVWVENGHFHAPEPAGKKVEHLSEDFYQRVVDRNENIKRYDWRINAEGDEEEYQTHTGRYMHADEVLRHINEVCALLPLILAPIGQESERYVFEISRYLRQG